MNNIDLENKIKNSVLQNINNKGYVCTIDILLDLKYLSNKDYEDWRLGKIKYLEKVCQVNLNKLTLIRKITKQHSSQLGLKSSWTSYNQFGKGKKQRLQFSKTGKFEIEEQYATHYIDKRRIEEIK